MKTTATQAARAGLALVLVFACSCYATFKFQPAQYNPPTQDLYAIFQDDFPFQISPLTPDPKTVVPPARPGCAVKLLPAGQNAFEIKFLLTENAGRSIKLQSYILYSDPVSRKLVEILKKKQSQGVKIDFIADCYTKFIPKDQVLYAKMTREGLDLLGYEPLYFLFSGDPRWIIDGNETNMRFHEKYWIFDDYAAITGGTNISQEYAAYEYNPRFMWRDQDVLLYGPIVKDISAAFDENMVYFSEKRRERPDLINPQFYKDLRNNKGCPAGAKSRPADESRLRVNGLTDDNVLARLIRHRPRLKETYIHQAYLHLFNTAQERILIENSYILLDDAQFQALTGAAKRGVEVTIVTNCKKTDDVLGLAPLSRYEYLPLIQAGIKIYEWQGIIPGKGSLHAKYMVVDQDVSVVGSYNLDPRSTFLNTEDVIVMRSQKVADWLVRYTEDVDMPQSKIVTMEQAQKWHNPLSPARLWTWVGLLFRDWW